MQRKVAVKLDSYTLLQQRRRVAPELLAPTSVFRSEREFPHRMMLRIRGAKTRDNGSQGCFVGWIPLDVNPLRKPADCHAVRLDVPGEKKSHDAFHQHEILAFRLGLNGLVEDVWICENVEQN